MQSRWRNLIEDDPFYNKNLGLESVDFSPSLRNVLPVQMYRVVKEAIDTPTGATGHLDRLSVEGDIIVGTGWARDPRTGTPANEVIIVNQEGNIFAHTKVAQERPDVAAVLRDRRMTSSGWWTCFSKDLIRPGMHTFHAYLIRENEQQAIRLNGEFNIVISN